MSIEFFRNYKILEKIGEGSFSEVLKVQNVNTRIKYAAKRLKHIYREYDMLKYILMLIRYQIYSEMEVFASPEVKTVTQLNYHPNVVGMYDVICDPLPGRITLILELMDMSLYDYIKNRRKCLSELKVKKFLYQLVCGLQHLHINGIFHRDIKPENILIKLPTRRHPGSKTSEVVQIADLGSVCNIYANHPHTAYISTRWYRAPECLLTSGFYGPKMDIWSLGCVYYEMLTLLPLFPGDNELDQLDKIHEVIGPPTDRMLARFKNRNLEYTFPKKKPVGLHNLVPFLSNNGLDVLSKTLSYLPDMRIDTEKLLQHAYFDGLRGVKRSIGEFSSTPSLTISRITTNSAAISSTESRYSKTVRTCVCISNEEQTRTSTKSLDSFMYSKRDSESYQMLMKRRERAWGMKPGAAKTALLKNTISLNKVR